ncbi:MAG: pirin family protein [Xanthomonadaceae bacterium]|nr:pirin family protein [Xanthomonadaceae bacterium]MDE2178698.1 pirin family protein [Xanthomonadaceae bacterium]
MDTAERLLLTGHVHDLGDGFMVRRLLPHAQRRMVGPFVFLDHLGPVDFAPGRGLDVRPHPHIGLATVTYLFDGTIRHRDSLGCVQDILPGDVNWMTAGCGIVHSERTPPEPRAAGHRVHGIQTWVALPPAQAECTPSFQHHPAASLPHWQQQGMRLRLIAGSAYGRAAPVAVPAPLFDIACEADAGAELTLPAEHAERAIYVLEGSAELGGLRIEAGQLAVEFGAAPGCLRALTPIRAMLFGGASFGPPPHVWWNFVAASRERIEQAKRDWSARRFGGVPGETEGIPLPDR